MNKARAEERIATYLSGNMHSGEQEKLMQWVNENPDNEKFFDKAVKIWSAADDYVYPDFSKGKNKAWNQLEKRTQNQPSAKIKRFSFTRLAVAASVALLIGAGWWWLNNAGTEVLLATQSEEQKELLLPDGTKVWVNENSRLVYNENKNERAVTLSGEAFFDVQTDSLRPFKIYTGNALTTVLGTSFNVRAYPNEPTVEVTVETGRVLLQEEQNKRKVELRKGEKGVYQIQEANVEAVQKPSDNAVAWKTGQLKFDETQMPKVLQDLERYFGVEIKLGNPAILNCPYTATFPKPTLEEVLQHIEFNLNLQLKRNGKTITLEGEGCL